MLKNGMDGLNKSVFRYVNTPSICKNKLCGKTLKNKKNYVILRIEGLDNGYWTLVKLCKRCNTENVNKKDD